MATRSSSHPTNRLEILLQLIEENCYCAEMTNQLAQIAISGNWTTAGVSAWQSHRAGQGITNHWRSFRQYLLESHDHNGPASNFDYTRFGLVENRGLFSVDANPQRVADPPLLIDGPRLLYRWVRDSRRVYRLTSDLQALINATSFRGVSIGEIEMPFATFAVELASPILGANGNAFDTLLFARDVETPSLVDLAIVCWLIDRRTAQFSPVVLPQAAKFNRLMHQQNWPKAKQLIERMQRELSKFRSTSSITYWSSHNSDTPLDEAAERYINTVKMTLREEDIRGKNLEAFLDPSVHKQALRILAGISLYLQSLAPESNHQSRWRPYDRARSLGPASSIASEAQVCELSTEYTLSSAERRLFLSEEVNQELHTGRRLVPHFRSGYWARPKGKGNDPRAKRTVWHRATVVNSDLLGDAQLPQGAKVTLDHMPTR